MWAIWVKKLRYFQLNFKNLCVKIRFFYLMCARLRSISRTQKSPAPYHFFSHSKMLGHSACKAHGSSLALIARSPASSCPRRLAFSAVKNQRIKLGSMYVAWGLRRNKRHGLASLRKDSKSCHLHSHWEALRSLCLAQVKAKSHCFRAWWFTPPPP